MLSVAESCGVCGAPAYLAVTCSGPCGKPFHPLCINLDTAHLRALADTTGVCWLCGDCRPDVRNLDLRKSVRDLNARMDSIDESLRDIKTLLASWLPSNKPPDAVLPEPQLPAELWEKIFHYLDPQSLLRIRRTCHRLKDIFDGCPKLVEQFTIHFLPYTIMDESYNPMPLFPAMKANFSYTSKIINVDTWWPMLGQKLTFLCLESDVSLPKLVDMLRFTPNLKQLDLGMLKYQELFDCSQIDYRLEKMESFGIEHECPANVLEVFGQLFPKLKIFEVCYPDNVIDELPLLTFIGTLRNSLEELKMNVPYDVWIKVLTMKIPHLKSIDYSDEVDKLAELCRIHQSLEYINGRICCSNTEICAIARHSEKLKELKLSLDPEPDGVPLKPTFLNHLRELEHLDLISLFQDTLCMNFDGIRNPNLRSVMIEQVQSIGNTLPHYLSHSLKLTSICFNKCSFSSWAEVFASLQCLKLLYNLQLSDITVSNVGASFFGYQLSVKRLRISNCNLPLGMLDTVLFMCPSLCNLSLTLDSADFYIIRVLGKLEKLYVYQKELTFRSAWSITKCCPSLKKVSVACKIFPAEHIKQLESQFGSRLITKNL